MVGHDLSSPVPRAANFIGGEWHTPANVPTAPVYNPSRGEVIAETPLCGADTVNEAVEAASDAFHRWADTPPTERARVFFRFKMLLEDAFDELAQPSRANTARPPPRRAATCAGASRWWSSRAGFRRC